MRRTVFYSWQSDLLPAANRNLIQRALERALATINKSDSETIEAVLDRDTQGVSGTPDIADSIFSKIIQADVFVADVSIVSTENKGRSSPNPNVLVELGYAISQLGWDRLILIMNSAYGEPSLLPFDLRGRRILTYSSPKDETDRTAARSLLQGRLETALASSLNAREVAVLPSGSMANLWWGKWILNKEGGLFGGELFIREVGTDGFLFDLMVYNGAHSGHVTAFARLVSKDLAYARLSNGEDSSSGEIGFRRSMAGTHRTIYLQETASCSFYRGARASFEGEFEKAREPWFDAGVMNELDLSRVYSTVGDFYDRFRLNSKDVSFIENEDDFEAKAIISAIPGLYTFNENIILLGSMGQVWAAILDDDCVYYFTNEPDWKEILPKTIELWRSRFPSAEVKYEQYVNKTPKIDGLYEPPAKS